MGTNYYAINKRIDNIEDLDLGLHIGKNSCGWVFNFEAHSNPELKSIQNYKDYLKEKFIYDEYAREIPYKEFWEIVESSKESFNSRDPYVLTDEEEPFRHAWYNEWVDEGFAFSEAEFV